MKEEAEYPAADADQRPYPWSLVLAMLVAMAALYVTSDQRPLIIPLLVVLLVVSQFTRQRLPRTRTVRWGLRAVVFTWIFLVMGLPEAGFSQWYVRPEYTNVVGCILAAEAVIRAWVRRDAARLHESRGIMLLLSGLVLAAGSNTWEPVLIQLLVPVYLVLILISLRSGFLPRVTRLPKLRGLRAAAAIASVAMGFGVIQVITSIDQQVQMWFMDLLRQPSRSASDIGLSVAPALGPVFNPQPSMQRVVILDGPVRSEQHLRVVAFDTLDEGQWRPTLRQRQPADVAATALQRPDPGQRVQFRIVGETLDMLPLPLNSAAVIAEADLVRYPDGALKFRSALDDHRYETVVSSSETFQGPLALPIEDSQRQRWLVLPSQISPKVVELARSIAGDSADPRMRVLRIAQHLRANHGYSLNFDPGTAEPLSEFILNQRAAHCQYFASALVVMARAAGVPARLVTGYYAHERSGDDRMIVRDRDAHAWAECWIDGAGWITLDATPAGGFPDALFAPPSRWRRMWEAAADFPGAVRDWLGQLSRQMLLLIVLVSGALALLIALLQALRKRRRGSGDLPYAQPDPGLLSIARRFERWMKRRGTPCAPNRTWREHVISLPEAANPLHFIELYEEARFGGADGKSLSLLMELMNTLDNAHHEKGALNMDRVTNGIFAQNVSKLEQNLSSVIRGKAQSIRLLLIALLSGNHALLEDMPGTGKTTLAKSLARSIDGIFRRVQFTPDLLPADITGSSFYKPQDGSFEFREGPIFTNVLLADEINRTSPRTQAALLEVMSENQVTVDGKRRDLPHPFFVVATQNPAEYHGTYPLPEAQLDRFGVRITMGYPDRASEIDVLFSQQDHHPFEDLRPVVSCVEILAMQDQIKHVRVEPAIADYIVRLVGLTRNDPRLRLGLSPRGSLALYRTSQAAALMAGRDYVIPEDVRTLAVAVLAHRIVPDTKAKYAGQRNEQIIEEAMEKTAVPR